MPKIHFTSSPKIPNDKVNDWAGYVNGSIHEVSESEAERWVKRGVAELITTRAANILIKENEKVEEVKIEEVVEEVKPIEEVGFKDVNEEVVKVEEVAPPVTSPYQPHRRR